MESFEGNMFVVENMKFFELVQYFFKYFPMKENEATFYFNLNEIKSSSCKTLKELGIKNMSTIEVFNNMDEDIEIVFNYKIVLRAKKGTKFSDLSKSFCSQAGILDKDPTFFFGSQKIKSTDNQTLSQLNI